MRRLLLSLLVALLPLVAPAQEEESPERDRDFLTGFLEDNLSGLGRTVRIDGFAGALSSRATFEQMTIADADGVWLTIRGGAIGWKRSALLRGRVEISEMTAEVIELPRRPSSGKSRTEASGFALPELPVSVSIGKLHADRVVLGEALFGAAAEVSLDGTMQLAGGEGSADLNVTRIDGREGRVSLTGSYANETRKATLDLLVAEAADGIAANLIGLPGKPSIELAIAGDGIIDDFRTDITLSTDGAPRLKGQVELLAVATEDGVAERRFRAALGGDIAPLLLPEYQDFFGPDVTLEAEGRRAPSGQLDLTRLVIGSRGVDVSGRLSLAPSGLPLQMALTTRIGLTDGSEVLLPLPGQKTYLRAAELSLRYSAERGDGWKLTGDLHGLRRADLTIAAVSLDGSGRIGRPGSDGVGVTRVGGHVGFAANGIEPTDPALASAVGPDLAGKIMFHWQGGEPLSIPSFDVEGQGYGASGGFNIETTDKGLTLGGRVTAEVADMGRFSGLAGRQLGGAANLEVSGSTGLLSGVFDLEGRIEGRDLSAGQAELDRLLEGLATVTASVSRGTEGIEIRSLDLSATTLIASASGHLGSEASDVTATLDFADLGALGAKYRGAMKADARLIGTGKRRQITLDASASGLGIGEPTADRLLAGASTLSLSIAEEEGRVEIDTFELDNPQLRLEATGSIEDDVRRVDIAARLNDMALLAPGFPGPLTLEGRVTESADGYDVDLSGNGPGATSADIAGRIARDLSTADVGIRGGTQSAILNPLLAPRNIDGPVSFDLRLSGPVRLESLQGRIALSGARLVAPTFGFEMEGLDVAADLAGGRANLSGGANVRGGGRIEVSGPVALTPPFQGDLTLRLAGVRLRDPDLYETFIDGTVSIAGPFLGGATIAGAINLDRTEVRIPSTGFGSRPTLTGLRHVNDPAAVRDTRKMAGPSSERREGGPVYNVDLTVSAPGRIFVRGRGLDAELGGTLRLTGTTANIVPSGRFDLIRGRLDILGKRFSIDEGLVELQGALTPYVRFAASSESDGITATIVIEGEASEPEIHFLSSPELPEEEVVAQLLFGRGLDNLSPFQAAQLASAIATLAGGGGEGLVSRLRGGIGLDDLDVTAAEDGTGALRAGKYVSERLYTDVEIGSGGKSEINLNFEIRKGLKARGSVDSKGGTGIGVFWERDY
ncbi:translocation/assembly module TamB domain-containing protein [Defluviimonas salinarum]|uniref:Translocation/assembly module TamB domain-containing protein n=1 Tax=Defluviimonas salinarum TaxID=2992147 RepID=A0ABT3J1C6_9RHOB|nr:translocation/assembly module TamB domain-containing protein [Defluviimonas salinarum]MCW3781487.1 translocation/assembly module TamB domain-containing protein [Defluviimonas salinarum]